jgi:hypothetical protein
LGIIVRFHNAALTATFICNTQPRHDCHLQSLAFNNRALATSVAIARLWHVLPVIRSRMEDSAVSGAACWWAACSERARRLTEAGIGIDSIELRERHQAVGIRLAGNFARRDCAQVLVPDEVASAAGGRPGVFKKTPSRRPRRAASAPYCRESPSLLPVAPPSFSPPGSCSV